MSSKIPSTSLFPTSKRSACDRCRSQKLRCPSRENGTQSCTRCIRAGVLCVTGYSKPLGRSVGDSATISAQINAQPAAVPSLEMTRMRRKGVDSTSRLSPETQSSSLTTTIESTSVTTEDARSSPWLLLEGSEDDHLLAQGCVPSPTQEDTLNPFGSCVHGSLLSDALFFSNHLNPVNNMDGRTGLLLKDSDNLSSPHFPSELATAGRMDYSDTIMKEPQHPSGGFESVTSGAECDLRLSRLGLDLCRQMQLCMARSQPWSTTTKDTSSSEDPFEVMWKGPDGLSNSNLFSDALCSTSEFLTIIQSYSCSASSPAESGNGRRTANNTSRSSLSFASILNLLLSYMRIIAIYDSLFLRLYGLLCCTASQGSVTGLQTLPGLRLAGFSVQQGSLQTKILIQAIQHQFEMIEKILGLPAEFRVSDRRDVYSMGLLEDKWARTLLQVVMSGQHGEGAPLLIDRDCTVGSLGSLQQNIMKVRQFLDM